MGETNTFTFVNSKGQTYYLHGKHITLKNGHQRLIYFFARDERPEFAMSQVPEGMEVMETQRTGMPVLRNIV